MSLPQPILAYVEGIDSDIRSLTPQEINALSDWFGQWLAKTPQATRALTLRALLKNALPADCYRSFGVADGLSIPYNTDNDDDPLNQVPRHMRFVVIALPDNPGPDGIDTTLAISKKTLCIVSSPFPDGGAADDRAFLQVASWDPNALGPKQGLMRFYQRRYEGWVYFGDSFNAASVHYFNITMPCH
ncbi:hypothetical protein BDZ89DRAFT_1042223 [Hymenopellis radicata]|nr:hypothetical protein BDZ89DRAFT_1042223 [Hymenopellis radicata]